MSGDEELITRIRPLLKRRKGYSERRMFGGLCFMLNGNMTVGTWKGSMIVRLEKDEHEQVQEEPHTREFDVTGRVMRGWARITPTGLNDEENLKSWVHRAARFAAMLPPKPASH